MSGKIIQIYTDGACRGNPGPGGWGVLLCDGDIETELYGAAADTTNNRMELIAAIEGLEALNEPRRVAMITDSQYVKNGITQWLANWKRKGWRTANRRAVKNIDLWQRLDEIAGRHDIAWQWVRGHSGHAGNERADQLANRAIDELLQGEK